MSTPENILPPQTAYRHRLSEMLDLTYELEGLLHIGVTRSSVPPRLNQLIVAKLNALVSLADDPAKPEELQLSDEVSTRHPDSMPEKEDDIAKTASLTVDDYSSEEVAVEDYTAAVEKKEESSLEAMPKDVVNEDITIEEDRDPIDNSLSEKVLSNSDEEEDLDDYPEDESEGESEGESVDESEEETEDIAGRIPELDSIVRGAAYYEPGAYISPDSYAEVEEDFPAMKRISKTPVSKPKSLSEAPKVVSEPPKVESARPAPGNSNRGKLFSVNDRFLFARELFKGNLADFDKSLNEVITLDSYDEAEEYMIEEWNIDPDNKEGIRFLSIISKLF